MERYDPEITPDAKEWLAVDEGERILLAEQYHRDARIRMPQRTRRLHACIHTAVENQLAAKDEPVIRAMERLRKDGLSRHEAVHAIGSCLTGLIYNIAKSEGTPETNREQYQVAIEQLTAKSWRDSFGD
jgi:hypothetical protein